MAGFALPRAARLRHRADFAALRHAPGHLQSRCLRLRYGANTAGTARLGLAVSRRVSTRAVVRNRIKRVIRESFRQRRERLPQVDILVIAHRAASEQSARALRAELAQLWPRVQALKGARAPITMTR
jgi:ribonuclease P protein component